MWHRMFVVALVFSAVATRSVQSTISQIRLADGMDDVNSLSEPVYDAASATSLTVDPFTDGHDAKALFVRRGGGNIFTRGPEYKLDPKVSIGALLTESVRTQAAAMGLKLATDAKPGWHLTGAVREAYLESRQVPYGSTLFYGYMSVDLQLRDEAGSQVTVPMRLHKYFSAYNAGMGRRDEAELGAAHLLIDGAQDLLARLNREHFHVPPNPAMGSRIAAIQAGTVEDHLAELRAIGLSGLKTAAATLVDILPGEPTETGRAAIISTLAILGSPDVVAVLASRYEDEDEDCRWSTLKALDYIGTQEALEFVRSAGLADDDTGPKRLAQRILKGSER